MFTIKQAGDYKVAIGLASTGKVDVKPLVSHRCAAPRVFTRITALIRRRFKFEDALNAFQVAKKGRSEDGESAMKIIISGPGVATDSF
jgi:D-xylulose reductase